jgi:DNA-binding CsgD family transcriptional regulator
MLDAQVLFRLTDYVVAMHEAKTFEQTSEVVRAGLEDLVPTDSLHFGLAPSVRPKSGFIGNWPDAVIDNFTSLAEQFLPEDPFHTGRLRLTLDNAAVVNHLLGPKALASSRMYNEVWRPFGFRHLLRAANPGKYALGFWLARTSDIAFNQQDITTLDVLSRHMNASISKLIGRHHGKLPTKATTISVETNSWLVCDHSGAIIRTTPDSIEHLRACLGENASLERVPAAWHRAYLARVAGGGPDPRSYKTGDRDITAHIAPIKGAPGEFTIFFVEHIREADPLASLTQLGLTNREAEVMKWMIEGKTNPEIGIIMGITPLTAKKHVENIRIKLNAPNRTAAVASVMEKISAQM